jgi:hypothetical protein
MAAKSFVDYLKEADTKKASKWTVKYDAAAVGEAVKRELIRAIKGSDRLMDDMSSAASLRSASITPTATGDDKLEVFAVAEGKVFDAAIRSLINAIKAAKVDAGTGSVTVNASEM